MKVLQDQGVHWLIAHPERNKAVMRNPDIIKPFVDMTDVAKHIDYHTAVAFPAHTFHNS